MLRIARGRTAMICPIVFCSDQTVRTVVLKSLRLRPSPWRLQEHTSPVRLSDQPRRMRAQDFEEWWRKPENPVQLIDAIPANTPGFRNNTAAVIVRAARALCDHDSRSRCRRGPVPPLQRHLLSLLLCLR